MDARKNALIAESCRNVSQRLDDRQLSNLDGQSVHVVAGCAVLYVMAPIGKRISAGLPEHMWVCLGRQLSRALFGTARVR